MAVSITLHQIRSTPSDFRVQSSITAHSGIEAEVFTVAKSGTGYIYQHVSTVADMETLPIVPPVSDGDMYRIDAIDVHFNEVSAALEHADYIKARLQELVTDYSTAVSDFEGTDDTVIIPIV